ncbi:MAG: hypothetical protein Q4G48_09130 [Bacteroidia bacterium]|nr:hypothetical protein [Bacteroidia bacterium]
MIREVIIPKRNRLRIDIPDKFIGKSIELILREQTDTTRTPAKTISELEAELHKLTVDMKGYKFDRNEANDYE